MTVDVIAPSTVSPHTAVCTRAANADPLGLDAFFVQHRPVAERPPEVLRDAVAAAVRCGPVADSVVGALAALRDLDFLLSAWHRIDPHTYRAVPGVETMLVHLGNVAGHVPRGSYITYAECNPLDDRMRTFTGSVYERDFVRCLNVSARHLSNLLYLLVDLANHQIDTPAAVAAAGALMPSWEPMVTAAVAMRRGMPPEMFSGTIAPCFVPLTIADVTYQSASAAQAANAAVDWMLWGADLEAGAYRDYASQNLASQSLPHQQLLSAFLDRTDGRTLLTFLDEQLSNPGFSARQIETADTVLSHIEALLRRISSFRAVHLRLAKDNLQLRPKPVGSGGHTAELLAQLASMTNEARGRVQGMRRRLRAQTC